MATEEARSLAAGEGRRVEVKIKGEVKSLSEISRDLRSFA